eukprot:CAMPEP_0115008412 /NCGR_PEP_ID=MMETSP0216-20121206/21905_1 /TAXON_ID=223996 /ORGANISM="Protocruzia adherens, Strain Boccale" /LENGTH=217 /DNA_ID=CAMNT_0002375831 /DNA_START=14 /DNA_END=667 /DNA_ORIENTATION=+
MIGGKLKFKSKHEKELKREKKAKKQQRKAEKAFLKARNELISSQEGAKESSEEITKAKTKAEPEIVVEHCSGRILSSGATIHGKETRFRSEVEVGDYLIIVHPTTLQKEERKIMLVLSDRSVAINEAFSSDLITSVDFDVKKTVQDHVEEEDEEKKEEEAIYNKFKPKKKKAKTVIEYRVKTGMSYKTVREVVDGELTKEEILNYRVKKEGDKFAWS